MSEALHLDQPWFKLALTLEKRFVPDVFLPFLIQFLVMFQHPTEIPINALVGRRLAAAAMEHGLPEQGVELLEQCLMAAWSKLDLRKATYAPGSGSPESVPLERRLGGTMRTYLGICVDVDMAAKAPALPNDVIRAVLREWLTLRELALGSRTLRGAFHPRLFKDVAGAAKDKVRVAVLNLWGSRCDAILLHEEGMHKHVVLEGVSEEVVAKWQKTLIACISVLQFRSHSLSQQTEKEDSIIQAKTNASAVFAAVWKNLVSPVFEAFSLKVRVAGARSCVALTSN